MTKTWITTNEIDPRLPTDPKYVAVGALAERYRTNIENLVEIARENPDIARASSGNPWTESEGREVLFLNEEAVSKRFRDEWK
jgi:hypothetical protein